MTRLVGRFFGAAAPVAPAVPYAALDQSAVVAEFQRRLANLEQHVKLSVPTDRILSAIAMTSDTMLLAAEKIALVGEVTFADWHRDVTGQATGDIDPSLTQIRGGVIRTGKIVSFAGDAYMDLDASGAAAFIHSAGVSIAANGSFSFGGAAGGGKRLTWDGSDLRIEGSALVGTSGGKTMADVIIGAEDGSSALVGLADKISKAATTIASSGFQLQTSGYAGGNGLAIYDGGMIFKYGGTAKFTFNAATGALAVAGDISGSNGSFAGDVLTNGFIKASGRTATSGFYAAITGIANQNGDAGGYFEGGAYGWGVYAISSRTGYPTIRARHTLSGSGTGYAIHADTNSDSGAAIYAQVNSGSGLAILTSGPSRFAGALDVQSSLQCDSLRIDQSPATGSATATFPGNNKPGGNSTCSWLSLNLNGTTYYLPAWT